MSVGADASVTPEELVAFARGRLARYGTPRGRHRRRRIAHLGRQETDRKAVRSLVRDRPARRAGARGAGGRGGRGFVGRPTKSGSGTTKSVVPPRFIGRPKNRPRTVERHSVPSGRKDDNLFLCVAPRRRHDGAAQTTTRAPSATGSTAGSTPAAPRQRTRPRRRRHEPGQVTAQAAFAGPEEIEAAVARPGRRGRLGKTTVSAHPGGLPVPRAAQRTQGE